MGKKSLRLAMEAMLGDCAAASTQANPVSVPAELDRLQAAEANGAERVEQILATQDNAVALESMQRSLKRPEALTMGKMGGRYFNIAAEQFMEQARVSPEQLPLDVRRYEQEPQPALDAASQQIDACLAQVASLTQGDLVNLMVDLTQKREAMVRVLQALHHRLDEVDEDLAAVEAGQIQTNPQALSTVVGTHEKYRLMAYSGLGVVAKGATVSSDILHLLDEHMAMYQRLVHSQAEWIRQHRDNLMEEYDRISEQYSFNPAEYLTAGVQYTHNAPDGAIFQSKALPGNLRFFCKTTEQRCFGYSAVEWLIKSGSWLAPDPQAAPKNTPSVDEIQALTLMEIKARVKEARMALLKLREWCDFVHRDLWAQAMFEDAIVEFMVKAVEVGIPGERTATFRRQIAGVVVKLLNEASGSLGSSLLGVLQGLVSFVEDSIRAHVPRHTDEDTP